MRRLYDANMQPTPIDRCAESRRQRRSIRACAIGPTIAVYVWQYPLRLVHWGLVISIGVLSFTGYYIHNPFIIGQMKYPFLMGWFRFVHEAFGMVFIALFLMRLYLFFAGNRWVRWRQYGPPAGGAVEGNVRGDEVLRLHATHAGLESRPQRHGGVFLHRHLYDWCWWKLSPAW